MAQVDRYHVRVFPTMAPTKDALQVRILAYCTLLQDNNQENVWAFYFNNLLISSFSIDCFGRGKLMKLGLMSIRSLFSLVLTLAFSASATDAAEKADNLRLELLEVKLRSRTTRRAATRRRYQTENIERSLAGIDPPSRRLRNGVDASLDRER